MESFWVYLGVLLVIFTFIDTFFTVLNYDEKGLFVNRFISLEWVLIRSISKRLNSNVRNVFLKQITGIILISVIFVWIAGFILGFALIFFGGIKMNAISVANETHQNFWSALYLSIGQFSTVGADGFTVHSQWIQIFTVVETMCSIVLLSMVITFLVNIYNSIQALRTLCASFPSHRKQVSSPLDSLASFFPDGDSSSLEIHLVETRTNLNGYFDSLAQDRPGYFFQSGTDRFAMPFGVFMVAGTIEGLYGGLPTGHPARKLPELSRLVSSFEGCQQQIYSRFKWKMPSLPEPLTFDEFEKQILCCESGEQTKVDPMVERFYTMTQSMLQMSVSETETDPRHRYQRYCRWLEFVTKSDDFIRKSSADLDYQPSYRHGDYPFRAPVIYYGWRPE